MPRRLRSGRRSDGFRHLPGARTGCRDARRTAPRTPRPDRSRGPDAVSSGSSRRAAASSSGSASLPRFAAKEISARSRSTRARSASSERSRLGRRQQGQRVVERAGVHLGLRARSRRCTWRGRVGVRAAAWSRNAAAAAIPPWASARPAERSSSAATASSGPTAAQARCQAHRSGSVSGSVTSASARCTSRRSAGVADR